MYTHFTLKVYLFNATCIPTTNRMPQFWWLCCQNVNSSQPAIFCRVSAPALTLPFVHPATPLKISHLALQYSAVQCTSVQCSALHYSAI